MRLTDRVRQAVRDDERSLRAIARELDVDAGLLSRFMNDRGGLALTTLERLVEMLGLELVPKRSKRRRTR